MYIDMHLHTAKIHVLPCAFVHIMACRTSKLLTTQLRTCTGLHKRTGMMFRHMLLIMMQVLHKLRS